MLKCSNPGWSVGMTLALTKLLQACDKPPETFIYCTLIPPRAQIIGALQFTVCLTTVRRVGVLEGTFDVTYQWTVSVFQERLKPSPICIFSREFYGTFQTTDLSHISPLLQTPDDLFTVCAAQLFLSRCFTCACCISISKSWGTVLRKPAQNHVSSRGGKLFLISCTLTL